MNQHATIGAETVKAAAPFSVSGILKRLWPSVGICLFLATIVWVVFGQTLRHGFINFDDDTYVYDNPVVSRGLTLQGIHWAFTHTYSDNWHPLTWISHMADCEFYGLDAGGHHLTNVLLHVTGAILLFLVLQWMTGFTWRSAFVAAVFAIHPLRVESVAWVAERKDVLSGIFFMLTIGAYANYARRATSHARWGIVVVLFALGLMCKPMLVSLPLVLLLLDYWPLRREEPLKNLAVEKTPFVILSAVASGLAIWAQRDAGAMENTPALSLRLENALVSSVKYLEELFFPTHMAIFYPYPGSISIWQVAAAAAAIGLATWAVIAGMKQRRYLALGWFWFLATLLPVIGVVQVGLQARADRYTYVPYIGLAVIVSWGLADLISAWPRFKSALIAVAALSLAGSMAATSVQIGYWRNSTSVYEHAVAVTSGNFIALNNLGNITLDDNKLDEAAKYFRAVVEIKPAVAMPYNSLGNVYALQGKLDEAMALFSKAIALKADLEEARYNLGNALMNKGRTPDAVAELKIAHHLKPDDLPATKRLAEALLKTGRAAEAIPVCEAVVKAEPKDVHARFSLGLAEQEAKNPEEALSNYKEAMRLSPDSPQCLNALAWIYATCPKAELRNGAEAVRLATQSCQSTKYQNPAMLDTLAAAYAEAGRFGEAVQTTQEIRALAAAAHDTAAEAAARQRLELYQAGKAYRDEP